MDHDCAWCHPVMPGEVTTKSHGICRYHELLMYETMRYLTKDESEELIRLMDERPK